MYKISRFHRRHVAQTALWRVLLSLTAMGCGGTGGGDGGSTAPNTGVVRVSVEPASLTLFVGQRGVATATAYNGQALQVTGQPVAWTSTAPQVATVDGTGTITAVSSGSASIRATIGGKSADMAVQVAPPLRGDVAIVDAQWTQGMQRDGDGGAIPMVEDRAAAVSVLLRATVANSAPGQLVLRLTDAAGTILRADTVTPAPVTSASFAQPSAQFLVPAAFVRAAVRWEVIRDPRGAAPDDSAANDRFPRSAPTPLRSVATSPLRIRFVPIVLGAHGNTTGQIEQRDIANVLSVVRSHYPHARVDATIGTPVTIAASFGTAPTGGSGPLFWNLAMRELDVARLADPNAGDSYWFGFVKPPATFTNVLSGGGGFVPANPRTSGPLTRTAVAIEMAYYLRGTSYSIAHSNLVAHELTHTFGRNHAPGCGAGEVLDRSFPTADGTIGVAGFNVSAWADGTTRQAFQVPSSTPDVMTYCGSEGTWMAPYTYEAVLNVARATTGTAIEAQRAHALVVEGTVQRDGRVSMGPVLPLALRLGDDAGPLLVEALDADGRVLARRRATPGAGEHDVDGARPFLAALPIREGDESLVAEVRVSGTGVQTLRRQSLRLARASLSEERAIARRDGAQVRCLVPGTVALVVTDASTGALIGRANGDRLTITPASSRNSIRVGCSDGIASASAVLE